MSSVPALDRTVALLRGDLFPTLDPDLLADELSAGRVLLGADRANLRCPAAQTALVTTFLAIAQCGLKVYLDIPDVAIAGPQPPLRGTQLRVGLLDLASDLITPASLDPAPPGTTQVLVGDTPAATNGTLLRIGGAPFRAELRVGPDARVEPFRGANPLGPVLAGIAAAAETMRMSARAIRDRHGVEVAAVFDLDGPREVELELPPITLPAFLDLGSVDFISAGAITNACLFVLLRVRGMAGAFRVIDADRGEETNLNRYGLLRRSDLDRPKVEVLNGYGRPGLEIKPLELRLEEATAAAVAPLAPSVVCGVDDIPSRWLVQGMGPRWLCVGGTSHFTVLVSEHTAGMPCAGCLHPEDDLDAPAELPTISFTSLLAGALQAHRLLAHATGSAPTDPTLGASFNLRAPHALEELPVSAREDCPVGCEESQALSDLTLPREIATLGSPRGG
jgi:molybdopterin/thiamine biosynthesis adenylyltransferase